MHKTPTQTKADTPDALAESVLASGDIEFEAKFLFQKKQLPDVVSKFWQSKYVLIIEQLVSRDESTYLQWARDLGFATSLPANSSAKFVRQTVDAWVDSVLDQRSKFWDQNIPAVGPIRTVQGELLYAMTNVDNTCRTAPDAWDPYLDALKSYIFRTVDGKNNFTHLVASTFINDSSELEESLPLPGNEQCAADIKFLRPTPYTTRLTRMWVVVLTWILRNPEPITYSGELEIEAKVTVSPQDLYKRKPLSKKMPKLDSYAEWAIDLGLDKETLRGLGKRKEVHDVIDNWISDASNKGDDLWSDLVPKSGVATTLQGELIRANGRIANELYKNGMMNWDRYYQDLIDLIGSTLSQESRFSDRVKQRLSEDVFAVECAGKMGKEAGEGVRPYYSALGGSFFVKTDVESALQRLGAVIYIWIKLNPDAIPYVSGPQ